MGGGVDVDVDVKAGATVKEAVGTGVNVVVGVAEDVGLKVFSDTVEAVDGVIEAQPENNPAVITRNQFKNSQCNLLENVNPPHRHPIFY